MEKDPDDGSLVLKDSLAKSIWDGISLYSGLDYEVIGLVGTRGEGHNWPNDSFVGKLALEQADVTLSLITTCCDR